MTDTRLACALHKAGKAEEERDFNLPRVLNSPSIEYRIHDNPRFNALLEKTGLNKYQILS